MPALPGILIAADHDDQLHVISQAGVTGRRSNGRTGDPKDIRVYLPARSTKSCRSTPILNYNARIAGAAEYTLYVCNQRLTTCG